MKPLYRPLNVATLHIASRLLPTGFDVAKNAPETFEDMCRHINSTGRILVWSGGSQQTIFACPEVNYAFRAWHDFHHWRKGLPFTNEGEARVAGSQIADLIALYGEAQGKHMGRIITAEVIGQLCHEDLFRSFPNDQYLFTVDYLAGRDWRAIGPY